MNEGTKKVSAQQLRSQLKALEKSVATIEEMQLLHEKEKREFMKQILDITKRQQINVYTKNAVKMHTTPIVYGAEKNQNPVKKRKKNTKKNI
jgi:hypothetical protein